MLIFYAFCHSFSSNPGPNLKKNNNKAHVKIRENMFSQYLEKRDRKRDRVELVARTKEKRQAALFISSWLRNFII